jgi:hypothetical protein
MVVLPAPFGPIRADRLVPVEGGTEAGDGHQPAEGVGQVVNL